MGKQGNGRHGWQAVLTGVFVYALLVSFQSSRPAAPSSPGTALNRLQSLGYAVQEEAPVEAAVESVPEEVFEEPEGEIVEEESEEDAQKGAEKLVKRFLKIKLTDRTAPGLLRALAGGDETPAGDDDEKPKLEDLAAQELEAQLISGDWEGLGGVLSELPSEGAGEVFDHVLKILDNDKVLMLADEVLALGAASPVELSDERLKRLGSLLGRSGRVSGRPADALRALELGVGPLGGTDPESRMRAARVLLGAEMVLDAYPFLPSLEGEPSAELLNLHALYHEVRGRGTDDVLELQLAWDLTLRALDHQESDALDAKPRKAALQRVLSLLSVLPEDAGDAWMAEAFGADRDGSLRLLALLVETLEGDRRVRAVQQRAEHLGVLARAVRVMLAGDGERERWQRVLDLLSIGWLEEAYHTLSEGPLAGELAARKNSPEWYADQLHEKRTKERRQHKVVAFDPADLLELAPDAAWLGAVEPNVARRLRAAIVRLAARSGRVERAMALISEEAAREPDHAKRLAERLLTLWAEHLRPKQNNRQRNFFSSSASYYYYDNSPGGIPLTRSRQARDLGRFAELLQRLHEIELPALDEDVLTRVFGSCHSDAEVYLSEDVERVFGAPDDLPVPVLVSLAGDLRRKLAGQWRKPSVQKKAETKRDDRDLAAEVSRGYELARELLDAARAQASGDPEVHSLSGSVLFDEAEFLYGQNEDLPTYVAIRDRAFDAFRGAADLYRDELPGKRQAEHSTEYYHCWFQSALGASDLAYLTRQDEPHMTQVEAIAAHLRALPAEHVDAHLELFGEQLEKSTANVPPQLKPHYVRQGLVVLGDHPGGSELRELLTTYDELLQELTLEMQLDGPSDVGHGRPFGVHLNLRYTRSLGREAGGFSRYLRNGVYTRNGKVDFRDDLENDLREVLSESFEIDSMVFHDPGVNARGFGRPGWRQTPFAYFVLRARDASVDRIPSVQLELEFSDGRGKVLLPIASPVVLVDARAEEPPPRPSEEVKVTLVLDDRSLEAEELVRLEVAGTCKGLLPDLDRLLEPGPEALPGFELVELHDQGLNVDELDAESYEVQPITQRSWMLELRPREAGATEFRFPTARAGVEELVLQRYADEDIVEVEPVVSLGRDGSSLLTLGLGLGGGVFVLAVGLVLLRRRGRTRVGQEEFREYVMPAVPSPFTTLMLLRRMRRDHSLGLSEAEQTDLQRTLDRLEERFFKPQPSTNGEVPPAQEGLDDIARRWVERTRTR